VLKQLGPWTIVASLCLLVTIACTEQAPSADTKKPAAGGDSSASSDASTGGEAAKVDRVNGWLHWRGPLQTGVSLEKNVPDKFELDGSGHLWTVELQGRGTPVVANGRVYAWGYRGEGANLIEVLACLDEESGKVIWEKEHADFLSDVIYDRYAIGAPTIDPETGNVYLLTTPGLLLCYTPDGEELWRVSMMEEFGRNTYPNGRTGAPVIDGHLVIVRGVSSNWGKQGPPRDRFYAFEKATGAPVWEATAGVGPPFLKDSDFATPVLEWRDGKRLFYSGLGSGSIVCINGLTGDPVWRLQEATGGINSTVLLHDDKVITVHDRYVNAPAASPLASQIGSILAIKAAPDSGEVEGGIRVLDRKDVEVWRNKEVHMFTSSPVLVEDTIYQVDKKGVLWSIDAKTGKKNWTKKLGLSQIHASPTYADGKLYVPMNDGKLFVLKPNDTGAEVLSEVDFGEGVSCLGAPAIWNGKVYVYTTKKLYCFGKAGGNAEGLPAVIQPDPMPAAGDPVALQIVPNEVLLKPGDSQKFTAWAIDANGIRVKQVKDLTWAKFIPPTAKVKAEMDADFSGGKLVAKDDAKASAGAYKATGPNGLTGVIRGRIVENLPYNEDFESFDVAVDHATEGVKFGYPPLQWIQARFRWEVREKDGSKVLAKTTDRRILQRALTWVGHPEDSNYTMTADVMSDGNRRGMGEVGLIHQRYIVVLKGNYNKIEVNSNQERIKEQASISLRPNVWYRIKTRVDVNDDGSGVIRAKAWPREEEEPDAWTIEVEHDHAHPNGAPGLFGFSPDDKYRVYIDNLKITPNE